MEKNLKNKNTIIDYSDLHKKDKRMAIYIALTTALLLVGIATIQLFIHPEAYNALSAVLQSKMDFLKPPDEMVTISLEGGGVLDFLVKLAMRVIVWIYLGLAWFVLAIVVKIFIVPFCAMLDGVAFIIIYLLHGGVLNVMMDLVNPFNKTDGGQTVFSNVFISILILSFLVFLLCIGIGLLRETFQDDKNYHAVYGSILKTAFFYAFMFFWILFFYKVSGWITTVILGSAGGGLTMSSILVAVCANEDSLEDAQKLLAIDLPYDLTSIGVITNVQITSASGEIIKFQVIDWESLDAAMNAGYSDFWSGNIGDVADGKENSIEFYLNKMGFEVSATDTGRDIVESMIVEINSDWGITSTATGDAIEGSYIVVSDIPFIGTSLEGSEHLKPTCDDWSSALSLYKVDINKAFVKELNGGLKMIPFIIGLFAILNVMVAIALHLIRRSFEIVGLIMLGTYTVSITPLDGGDKFKEWRENVQGKFLEIFFFNLIVVMYFELLLEIGLFTSDFENAWNTSGNGSEAGWAMAQTLFYLFLIWGGGKSIMLLPAAFSGIAGRIQALQGVNLGPGMATAAAKKASGNVKYHETKKAEKAKAKAEKNSGADGGAKANAEAKTAEAKSAEVEDFKANMAQSPEDEATKAARDAGAKFWEESKEGSYAKKHDKVLVGDAFVHDKNKKTKNVVDNDTKIKNYKRYQTRRANEDKKEAEKKKTS